MTASQLLTAHVQEQSLAIQIDDQFYPPVTIEHSGPLLPPTGSLASLQWLAKQNTPWRHLRIPEALIEGKLLNSRCESYEVDPEQVLCSWLSFKEVKPLCVSKPSLKLDYFVAPALSNNSPFLQQYI